MNTSKCKWQQVDDEEKKLLEGILEQYDGFEYDENYTRGKTFPNGVDTMLEVAVIDSYYCDTRYDGDLLVLVERAKDIIYDLEQEGYYSIKFFLDHGPDFMCFSMRLYRVRTDEEREVK